MGINSHFNYWNRPKLTIFTEEQHKRIYNGALEILERVGSEFHSEEAVSMLEGAGATVVDDNVVKMPSSMVENALNTCGKRLVLSDRNLNHTMFLEGDNTYFGPGSETPYTIDPYTGERRSCEKNDVVRAATVVDKLENIDFVMSFALANDVPKANADLHHFEAMVKNTAKPILFTAWDLDGLKGIYEMSVAVAGGEEEFRTNPFILLYDEPSSPLKHSKEAVEKLIYSTEKGIPIQYVPTPSLGAAGPISLAGAYALTEAEYLAGLVLSQVVREGSTLIFGGGPTTMDMKTTVFSYSAPETMLSLALRKEAGDYLGVPAFNAGGFTDSKEIDQQAGLEVANSLNAAALAGGNIVHDVGYLESGMTSSLELLTIADEEISMIDRFIKSVQVNRETIGVDEIAKVGPGGNYLTSQQTISKFKEDVWSPDIIDRNVYEGWEEKGKKSLRDKAREKVQDILENHEPEELNDDVSNELAKIVEKYEKERK
ncbi:trimethylamine methyltransferase family protein [Candidatus Bipolaricaulota bacterium]|nr:trimethylamine methyltransferase family protein [Candidatus Bipolaricaulota bacterium]